MEAGGRRLFVAAAIPATPERVWAELTDFARMHEWFLGVRRLRVTPPEAGLGASRELTLLLGLHHDESITEWKPPRVFALEVQDPPLFARRFAARIEVVPAGPGARVEWEMAYESRFGAAGRVLDAALIAPTLRFALRTSLRRLRERIEGSAAGVGSRGMPGPVPTAPEVRDEPPSFRVGQDEAH